jgi:hypothetical protein
MDGEREEIGVIVWGGRPRPPLLTLTFSLSR